MNWYANVVLHGLHRHARQKVRSETQLRPISDAERLPRNARATPQRRESPKLERKRKSLGETRWWSIVSSTTRSRRRIADRLFENCSPWWRRRTTLILVILELLCFILSSCASSKNSFLCLHNHSTSVFTTIVSDRAFGLTSKRIWLCFSLTVL